MAAVEETIVRVPWCDEADHAFQSHPDTAEDLDNIRQDVTSDSAQLWRFSGPAEMWLVTRLERYPSGRRELVLVNAIGKNSRLVLDVCERLAKQLGAEEMRCHVRAPGLMRILETKGWGPDRTVYKKRVSNV